MTHWRACIDKDYLGSYDLVDKAGKPKDYTLQIVRVEPRLLKTAQNPKGKRKCVVTFLRAEKKFVANSTNCTLIEAMYGPDIEGWVGKKITLYQGEVRSPAGGTTMGIKVRPKIPGGPAEAIAAQPVDEARRTEQARAFGDDGPPAREPGEEG